MPFRLKSINLWISIAAVLLLLTAWEMRGILAFVYARRQAVAAAPGAEATQTKPRAKLSTFVVNVDGEDRGGNLFYSSSGKPWQAIARHRLHIGLGPDAPTLDIESFSTLIDYRNGKLDFVTFYPVLAPVSYSAAIAAMEQLLTKYGLHDRVKWNQYAERLRERLSGRETFIPTIEFGTGSLSLFLNCSWEYDALPAGQVNHITCGPYLAFNFKQQRSKPALNVP